MKELILWFIVGAFGVFVLGMSILNYPVTAPKEEPRPVEICEGSTTFNTWPSFIEAVAYVESRNNPDAYNAKEDAVGYLQIRPIMVEEINRLAAADGLDVRYTLEDRWSKEKSIDMFNYLATKLHRGGRTFEGYCEVVARTWNGGWTGPNKPATKKYWNKIKEQL